VLKWTGEKRQQTPALNLSKLATARWRPPNSSQLQRLVENRGQERSNAKVGKKGGVQRRRPVSLVTENATVGGKRLISVHDEQSNRLHSSSVGATGSPQLPKHAQQANKPTSHQ
jgi:hypothetical protein